MFAGDPDFEVVGEAGNGREAVSQAEVFRPDVVLMDLRMPEMDGVAAIKLMAERGLEARVLVLTTYDTEGDVLPAIEAGATATCSRTRRVKELYRAVRAAAAGEAVLSPPVASRLMGQMREGGRESPSEREMEILRLVAGGATNREIAARLFISEATVKTHLLHLFGKLGVNDRAGAWVRLRTGFAHPRRRRSVTSVDLGDRPLLGRTRHDPRRTTDPGCSP